jgi:ABC-2 type transport system ATP-binding protein
MAVIEARGLCKTYTTVRKEPGLSGAFKSLFRPHRVEVDAVRDVNLTLHAGEMVGFLGPNGAGKTTTLKMLSGILFPTAGTVQVLGYTPQHRRPEMLRQIALVMGNKMQLWWDLPAWDSFLVLKELYEVDDASFRKRAEALVDGLSLGDKVSTQLRRLSLGERMKCELVAALLHSPKVVFLDEPTLGLDVISQKRIREFLREMHDQEGTTILLTSHYMQDVQELCDRVVVIDHGTLIFEGTLQELSSRFSNTKRLRLTLTAPVEEDRLIRFGKVVRNEGVEVYLDIPKSETAPVTSAVLTQLPVADLSIEETDIEDVIRDLYGKDSR